MILIALLSGGDYCPQGLRGCGIATSVALSKCGFGRQLLRACGELDDVGLRLFLIHWRDSLRSELRTNSSGHLPSKEPSLADALSPHFPDISIIRLYTNPLTSATHPSAAFPHPTWDQEIDLGRVGRFCETRFEWGYKDAILKRFRSVLWPGVIARIMRRVVLDGEAQRQGSNSRHMLSTLVDEIFVKIHSSRRHTSTGDTLEYRLEINPAPLVSLTAAGLRGDREPIDRTYDVDVDSDVDDDIGSTSGECTSALRLWVPASVLSLAAPDLVNAFKSRQAKKKTSKAGTSSYSSREAKGISNHPPHPPQSRPSPQHSQTSSTALEQSYRRLKRSTGDPSRVRNSTIYATQYNQLIFETSSCVIL